MPYVGKTPVVGNFVKLDTITTSATTTFNLTNGGVAYSPQSPNHCIVSLNGVIQSPNTSFTISGSTIVFASALTATDVIDFILVLGDVLNIGTPSDATVGFSKITSNLITGATAETSIADADTLLIYDDSATALRKMTKANFVSGLGASTPAFFVTQFGRGSDQTGLSDNTDTKVQFTTEMFDTDSAYDNSTNYRFTVPSGKAGKYFFSATVNSLRSGANPRSKYVSIYKNGGTAEQNGLFMNSTSVFEGSQDCTINCTTVLNLIAGDYIEVFFRQYDGSSGTIKHNIGNHFYGYRITGV